jgi:hypothetical protein
MTNNVRIKMEISTNIFEDSILDIMMLRFSKLIQDIFEELDDKSLTTNHGVISLTTKSFHLSEKFKS